MAQNDITVVRNPHGTLPVQEWQTDAGATDINAGEPVKLTAAGSPYATPLADGDLTIGTDTAMLGIAATDSTHTATADGIVQVLVPLPGVVYRAAATTAGNVAATLVGDRVTIDLSGGVYTIDENAGDNANNAFYIVDVDADAGTVDFTVRLDATYLAA